MRKDDVFFKDVTVDGHNWVNESTHGRGCYCFEVIFEARLALATRLIDLYRDMFSGELTDAEDVEREYLAEQWRKGLQP